MKPASQGGLGDDRRKLYATSASPQGRVLMGNIFDETGQVASQFLATEMVVAFRGTALTALGVLPASALTLRTVMQDMIVP